MDGRKLDLICFECMYMSESQSGDNTSTTVPVPTSAPTHHVQHKTHHTYTKCQAIQYGLLIACVIIGIVVAYNWYATSTNSCLDSCKTAKQKCQTSCRVPDTFRAQQPARAALANNAAGKLSESRLHEGFLNYSEGPTFEAFNDAPSAYDPAHMSLEQSVFESHREFVDDSYVSTQGPSSGNSVRDDTNEINKRVGLRRTNYMDIQPADDVRTTSSEYADQVQQKTNSFIL